MLKIPDILCLTRVKIVIDLRHYFVPMLFFNVHKFCVRLIRAFEPQQIAR